MRSSSSPYLNLEVAKLLRKVTTNSPCSVTDCCCKGLRIAGLSTVFTLALRLGLGVSTSFSLTINFLYSAGLLLPNTQNTGHLLVSLITVPVLKSKLPLNLLPPRTNPDSRSTALWNTTQRTGELPYTLLNLSVSVY